MADQTVRFVVDTRAIQRDLTNLAELGERVPQLFDCVIDLIDALPKTLRVHSEGLPAGGASEIRIELQIPDALGELLAAMRARDVHVPIVEN